MNGVNGVMPPVGQLPSWSTVNRPPVGTSNPNLGTGYFGFNTTLSALEYWNGTAWIVLGQGPTAQRLTATGTCTPSAGVVRWRVRMVGSGAGGGARTTNFGNGGGTTTFGAWTALGGSGGSSAGGSGGAGGTGGANGTGTLIYRVQGNDGSAAGQDTAASVVMAGGVGGNSMLGSGATVNNGTGATARANSGGGGQGAGGSATAAGSGGGAGEYVEFWVNNPAATSYTITAGGLGGAAGVLPGGDGGSGFILVEEYYQ